MTDNVANTVIEFEQTAAGRMKIRGQAGLIPQTTRALMRVFHTLASEADDQKILDALESTADLPFTLQAVVATDPDDEAVVNYSFRVVDEEIPLFDALTRAAAYFLDANAEAEVGGMSDEASTEAHGVQKQGTR